LAWSESGGYIHQLNPVNSLDGYVMMAAVQSLSLVLLGCIAVLLTYTVSQKSFHLLTVCNFVKS